MANWRPAPPATRALDLSEEPAYVHKMYGLENAEKNIPRISTPKRNEYFGRKCLIARRLIERGVRFVQVWSGNDNGFPRRNWDSHEDMTRDHPSLADGPGDGRLDQGLQQWARRGQDHSLTTEFGRMPSSRKYGPGSQPLRFHQLVGRGRFRGWGDPRGKRPVGLQALDRKTRPKSMTLMPRCSISSA